jgi:hypothetical protein
MNRKVDLKDFAIRNRLKYEVVVKLSQTHNFQADLSDFIERFWMDHGGYGELYAEAIRQLHILVQDGNIKAIQTVLNLKKIMGRGEETTDKGTFEENLGKMKRANSE